jgi:hypothetical protein
MMFGLFKNKEQQEVKSKTNNEETKGLITKKEGEEDDEGD